MKRLIKICVLFVLLSLSSGCKTPSPDIISVGECERGVVTEINLAYVRSLWPQADITDVLISGGCYQDKLIKKR